MAFNKQQYEDSKKNSGGSSGSSGSGGSGGSGGTGGTGGGVKESASDYADWDYGDWEGYFAKIRSSEGKSAAEKELERMNKAGYIPKNMIVAASIGARGSLGH